MRKTEDEFLPIKIDDKSLISQIEGIRLEKEGFSKLLLDMAKARSEVADKGSEWFKKVIKKYNIPEKYWGKLSYDFKENEIRVR